MFLSLQATICPVDITLKRLSLASADFDFLLKISMNSRYMLYASSSLGNILNRMAAMNAAAKVRTQNDKVKDRISNNI